MGGGAWGKKFVKAKDFFEINFEKNFSTPEETKFTPTYRLFLYKILIITKE